MLSLPQEIEEEVLLRLPVKSLLCFKSVCRNWRKLLCSLKFIKDHLSHSSKNPRIMIRDIKFPHKDMYYSVGYASILTASASVSSSPCNCVGAVLMDTPIKQKNGVLGCYTNILGSCGGLLCLGFLRSRTPILWNPSTKEYKEIIGHLYWSNDWYGFGYDNKINDYKLVCISEGDHEVHVYTLEPNSWRRVDTSVPYYNCCFPKPEGMLMTDHPRGLLLNGALHWSCYTATEYIPKAIVSFDISNEKFKILPFPKDLGLHPYDHCDLSALGDSLCLVCLVPGLKVDVWVMQNYGVRESWTKKFTTTKFLEQSVTNFSLENGEILIQLQRDFVLYDQNKDRIRHLQFNGIDRFGYLLRSWSYVESLVSLNSGTYTTS